MALNVSSIIPQPVTESSLYRTPPYWACRSAVLGPLAWRKGTTLPAAYAAMKQQWHFRVHALRLAGWSSIVTAGGAEGIALRNAVCFCNCPLFGVALPPGFNARPCNRGRICPNCFARQVVLEAYDSFDTVLRLVDGVCRPVQMISVIRRTADLPEASRPWRGKGSWAAMGREALFDAWSKFKPGKVLGARMLVTFAPQKAPGMLTVTASTLLLVPQGLVLPDLAGTVRSVSPVTATDLGRAVAAVFRYPVGMMRGDAATAARILHGLARVKLAASAGLCDNDKHRDILRRHRLPSRNQTQNQTGDNRESETRPDAAG